MDNDKEKKKDTEESTDADEITFEDEEESSNPQAIIKRLRERLKKAESEKLEFLTGWQKDKADFINLRKRDEADKIMLIKFANEALVEELIPVLDSFEQARKDEKAWLELSENWRKGIESSLKELHKVLDKAGLVSIGKAGEQFDPAKHEAVSMTKITDKRDDHTVQSVFQTGYELNGKVIRPAKVVVGEYSE